MIVIYLGVDPGDSQKEKYDTRGCHAKFVFLEMLYKDHLIAAKEEDGDYARVMYHRGCACIPYLIYFVGISIFVNKSEIYVDVVTLESEEDGEWM